MLWLTESYAILQYSSLSRDSHLVLQLLNTVVPHSVSFFKGSLIEAVRTFSEANEGSGINQLNSCL